MIPIKLKLYRHHWHDITEMQSIVNNVSQAASVIACHLSVFAIVELRNRQQIDLDSVIVWLNICFILSLVLIKNSKWKQNQVVSVLSTEKSRNKQNIEPKRNGVKMSKLIWKIVINDAIAKESKWYHKWRDRKKMAGAQH